MDCRTTPTVNFKTRLGFNQYDPIITQEQSILSKIMRAFSTEEVSLQHIVLGYRIDAYFIKHKLAIEIDEQGYNNRNIDYEIKRQKAIKKELGCEFIRFNPAKKGFDTFTEIGRILSFIDKSTKNLTREYLIYEISNKLSRLALESKNSAEKNV